MRQQIRCHGDERRFEVVADFIGQTFGGRLRYVADVAGGQGLLSRILRKSHNMDCDVIDPRGWSLKGAPARAKEFDPSDAEFYDLVVGLHPDQALRAVIASSCLRPTLLVPCCNYWSERRISAKDMRSEIAAWYDRHGVIWRGVELALGGPHRHGFVTEPPRGGVRPDIEALRAFSRVPDKRPDEETRGGRRRSQRARHENDHG